MDYKYPKILVISAWYPNSLHEAEGDFIRHQVRQMTQEGLDINVFHVSMSIRYLLKGTFIKKVVKKANNINEHVIEMPFGPRNYSWGIKHWAKRYKKEIIAYCQNHGWPDIIHAHTYLGGYVASLIKHEKGIPYIMTLHESYIISNDVPRYHVPLLKRSLSEAGQVTAVGDKLAESINRYVSVAPSVLPNFIDFNKFGVSKEKHPSFSFVFVGELIPRKRVNVLIEAFNQLRQKKKSIQLNIIGDGPLLKPLKNQVQRLNCAKSIHFLGRLNQNEVSSQLKKNHCLVLPSKVETFGIVLIEALACGVPFISTHSGVTERWFNHVSCNFIGQTSQELENAMDKIIVDFKEFNPIEICDFAKEKFSSPVVVDLYKEMYLSLTGKS